MIYLYLLALVPVSLALAYLFHASPIWVFISSAAAVIPLAVWIRRSTEQLADRLGSSIGGLLNVTFGNAAELIIALFVLTGGQPEVVKGQITGSIIGNALFGLGLAILIGTWHRRAQTFNRDQAGQLSTMLTLVLIGLLLPAIFDFTERDLAQVTNTPALDESLSLAVSVVLILLYFGNLVYTLITHRDVFSGNKEASREATSKKKGQASAAQDEGSQEERWPLWLTGLVMLGATALTALEAELLSSSVEATAGLLGVTTFFLGVVVLALIGNVAEYVSAIFFAREDDQTLVMSITIGGTIQVALLVAPVLVLVSYFLGKPMNLVFGNPIELIAIAAAALAIQAIAKDGEVTWFEGLLLIGVYLLMAIAFFYVTP